MLKLKLDMIVLCHIVNVWLIWMLETNCEARQLGLDKINTCKRLKKNTGIQHWFHYVENLFCKIGIARMSLWSLFGFWEEVMSLRFFSSCFNDSSQSKSAASLKIQMDDVWHTRGSKADHSSDTKTLFFLS